MKLECRIAKGFQRVLIFLGCLVIASGVMYERQPQSAFADSLYGITECCPHEYVIIDPNTWKLTPVSTLENISNPFQLVTIVRDPNGHRFFMQNSDYRLQGPDYLVTMDTETGATSESLPLSRGLEHLGFDPTVALFGITRCCPHEFVTIDLSTGILTPLSVVGIVGDYPFQFYGTGDAVDPTRHRFFVSRSSGLGLGQHHIIAIDTRTGTVVESPPMSCGFRHLIFDPGFGLFGITDNNYGCTSEFVSIDPSTWVLTPLAVVGDASTFLYHYRAVVLDRDGRELFVQGTYWQREPYVIKMLAMDIQTGAISESPPLERSLIHLSFMPDFLGLSPTHWALSQIKAIFAAGITAGCSAEPPLFCPDAPVTRGQMAVFLAASLGYSSGFCNGRFKDVPVGHPFCGFIERLYIDGITDGCNLAAGRTFCPDEPVTRGQMAVFVETALGNPPDPCTGQFADVPLSHPFCGFLERLAADGITGGCGGGNFCPNDPVTRAQMAVFLVAAPDPLKP